MIIVRITHIWGFEAVSRRDSHAVTAAVSTLDYLANSSSSSNDNYHRYVH